jgi:hypothetical protein
LRRTIYRRCIRGGRCQSPDQVAGVIQTVRECCALRAIAVAAATAATAATTAAAAPAAAAAAAVLLLLRLRVLLL